MKFLATSKAKIKKQPNAKINPVVWWFGSVASTIPATDNNINKTHLKTVSIISPS